MPGRTAFSVSWLIRFHLIISWKAFVHWQNILSYCSLKARLISEYGIDAAGLDSTTWWARSFRWFTFWATWNQCRSSHCLLILITSSSCLSFHSRYIENIVVEQRFKKSQLIASRMKWCSIVTGCEPGLFTSKNHSPDGLINDGQSHGYCTCIYIHWFSCFTPIILSTDTSVCYPVLVPFDYRVFFFFHCGIHAQPSSQMTRRLRCLHQGLSL